MQFKFSSGLLLALVATASARRVVPVKIQKAQAANAPGGLLPVHRRAAFDEDLANNLTSGAYFATIEIGSPGQTVTLHVDTGSTDIWLLSSRSNLCTNTVLETLYGYCLDTFDSSKSSTYETVRSGEFSVTYMDGSGASGDYFTDDINVGGLNVTGVQMGLAKKSTSSWGMMGIGYTKGSKSASNAVVVRRSIVDDMYDQGLIGIKAYSLYLNDIESSTGTILFGGIDTEKFIGALKTVPTLHDTDYGFVTHFNVSLTSLSVISDGSASSVMSAAIPVIPVILDSGTTLTYLPSAVTAKLFAKLNAYEHTSGSFPNVYVDCSIATSSLVIQYQFGGADGPAISVSIADVVFDDVKALVSAGYITLPRKLPFDSDNVCSLGIMTSESGDVHLLGDTFLRSAYVVYDLSNDQIALAQSNLNSTKENIIEIPTNATGVPLATGVPVPVPIVAETPEKENGTVSAGSPLGWALLLAMVGGALFSL